ncbi:hypothetical protein N0V84_012683, partial [Fusarium piperis]
MKDLPLAVGFAAKLKPEIRLAQAISEFNASLSNNNQRTRFKNLQSKSPPTPVDIIRLTEEINRDGAKAHRSWRPYGTRLVAILERMRQFAPVGDVLVGGSQNLIACGVWAVVRLSLETSLSFLSYFENVTSDVTVSYFFCQTNNPKTLSASALLGSIAGQVLQNPALGPSLMSFLEQLETVLNTCAMPEEYIDILLKATPPNWRGIFVLDGLDEMPEEEVDDIFGQLHRLGQHRWIQDICPRYTQELRSDAEILDILGNLPNDLPGAFDKALSRVRDGKYGNKLFQLVASAEPPLNMDELRIASNVEPGNTRWDRSTLSSSGKTLLSAYGGSLLDVDEEDLSVRFIHYSVLLHLTTASSGAKTHAFHFDLKEAERTLGSVCVTYLNYSVFENRVSTAQKASFGQVPQAMARSVMPSEVFRKGLDLLS